MVGCWWGVLFFTVYVILNTAKVPRDLREEYGEEASDQWHIGWWTVIMLAIIWG